MATFSTMKTRLELILSKHLTQADIGKLLNRVHQEEVENHAWHRLRTQAILNTTAPITTGTVSITQGDTAVTGVGTAFAAADVGKYIRIDGDDTPLKVATWTSVTAITVEQSWAKATASAVAYSLFPLRYALPTAAQKVNWIKRSLPLIETTQETLNAIDPERTSTAETATQWAPAERDSSDLYQVELWPVASTPVAYSVEYLKGHTDMSAPGDAPLVPSSVIENKALHDALMAEFIRTGQQSFYTAAEMYGKRYLVELDQAKIRDRMQYGVPLEIESALRVDYEYAILHNVD